MASTICARPRNALWIVLQLREASGFDEPYRFLIFDRDAKFSADVVSAVEQHGAKPVRTAFRSPWQNGIAERWAGSVRRDLLDHAVNILANHNIPNGNDQWPNMMRLYFWRTTASVREDKQSIHEKRCSRQLRS